MDKHALRDASTLEVLKDLLDPLDFMAGWNKKQASLWAEPRTAFVPAHWRWSEAKAGLDAAGRLIDTDQADRRNLFMVNPHEGNDYATVRTVVSAYQMILPGERARSHRHTPHALRFVLDVPDGAYTVVDGVRIDMRPGDVLLTPGWSWHGHGNDGDAPAYWIDFLDVPTVQLLEPMRLEHWPGEYQAGSSTTRDHHFVFPWSGIDAALDLQAPDPLGRLGTTVDLDSEAWIPSLTLRAQRLEAGFQSCRWRSTASQIVSIKSGCGDAWVGERHFQWQQGDVFVVPGWQAYSLSATTRAELFVVSDEAMQKRLGYFHAENL